METLEKKQTAPESVTDQPAPAAKRTSRKKSTKPAKAKKKLPPPTRMTDAGYGALKALKAANPEMSHTEIVSAALIAMATNSAFQRPIQLQRICKNDLLILSGIVADAEAALKYTFRKIYAAKIDAVKKAQLAEDVDTHLLRFKELRQTICREAGIPVTNDITTDVTLAIQIIDAKKQVTPQISLRESYDNVIQLLARYRLDTYEPPETPGQALTTDLNP